MWGSPCGATTLRLLYGFHRARLVGEGVPTDVLFLAALRPTHSGVAWTFWRSSSSNHRSSLRRQFAIVGPFNPLRVRTLVTLSRMESFWQDERDLLWIHRWTSNSSYLCSWAPISTTMRSAFHTLIPPCIGPPTLTETNTLGAFLLMVGLKDSGISSKRPALLGCPLASTRMGVRSL